MIVYICGDSFACSDPYYGEYAWVDLLKYKNEYQLNNLSRVGASNLQISLQIQEAIRQQPDFIIYLATSSVRNDIMFADHHTESSTLLSRYTDIVSQDNSKELVSYSIPTIHNVENLLSKDHYKLLTEYHNTFFNLDLAVHQNHLIIEGTLSLLESSRIPYVFDQGGFEHPKYTGKTIKYFPHYQHRSSELNLWNFVEAPLKFRPYFHITDKQIHINIAEYYHRTIIKQ